MIAPSDPFEPKRLPWHELTRRCQKPDHRQVGTWMARRVVRPLAQAITWVLAPWSVSPHAVTLLAWAVLGAAAACLAQGTPSWAVAGAAALQLWYLLDHVDGQLARLQRRETLEGTLLDYLMHHSFFCFVPLGVGWGLFSAENRPGWLLAGLAWGWGAWLVHAVHDARYKAFFKRLKRTRGPLHLCLDQQAAGMPGPEQPRGLGVLLRRLGRKLLETHVTMNLLTLLAAGEWLAGNGELALLRLYAGAMALLAPAVALGVLWREVRLGRSEAEFVRWFQPPPGHGWQYEPGRWSVVPQQPPGESAPAALGEAASAPVHAVERPGCEVLAGY